MRDLASALVTWVVLVATPLAAVPSLAGCATAAPEPEPQPRVVHAPPQRPADGYAALVEAANARARAGDFAKALALADEALATRPFGIAAGVVKVEAHLGLGQRTEAVDFGQRLRDRNPSRPEAYYAYGKAQYALGRLVNAREMFADGLELAPDDRLLLIAYLTLLTNDPKVELAELQQRADALMSEGPDPDVLHALGMGHELRGDNAGADALYVRAIDLRPVHPFAHYNLARLREATSGMRAARPHYQAFLEQAPPSAAREIEAVKKLLQGEHR